MEHLNVADYLADMAAAQPDKMAVALLKGSKVKKITCRDLSDKVDTMAAALQEYGFTPGTRVAMMVTPGVQLFVLTFALFKIGAVMIFVDPGIGLDNVTRCLAQASPQAFVGLTKAHVARLLKGWGRPTVQKLVTVGPRLFWGGETYESLLKKGNGRKPQPVKVEEGTLAAINFTSGSTGPAKGASYTHGMFAEQVRLIRDVYQIRPGEVDCSTFPLFALFGAAMGMASVVPDMDCSKPGKANPANIVKAITDFQCTNMFANPAVVALLGRYCAANNVKLPSLRRVISCGAPASVPTLRTFAPALNEGVEIHTPYGATEAMPLTDICSSEIFADTAAKTLAGGGVCVGRPNPDIEIRVIGITDDPIAEWSDDLVVSANTIGEIVVKARVASREYYDRPAATKMAKITAGDSFWHRMGDVGYFDEQGRLWMCGRKAHRVVTAGRTYFSLPAEAIFNQCGKIARSALVGVVKDGVTMPVMCIELPAGSGEDKDALTGELLALAKSSDHSRGIENILFYPGTFPVDIRHNAKIFREKLAAWATTRI